MKGTAEIIERRLKALVGLQLTIARRAADLRNFQFGPVRAVEGGTLGEYALHIQCPWRLQDSEGIVTGRSDLWEAADPNEKIDWDSWHYDKNENLQDRRIGELLRGRDPATRSFVNETGLLVVEVVCADAHGGAIVSLSGGYELVLFPGGSEGEDWRLFRPGEEEPHFVVAGGKVQQRGGAA